MSVEPAWRVFISLLEKERPELVDDVMASLHLGEWDAVAEIAVGLSLDAENAFKRARAENEEKLARLAAGEP